MNTIREVANIKHSCCGLFIWNYGCFQWNKYFDKQHAAEYWKIKSVVKNKGKRHKNMYVFIYSLHNERRKQLEGHRSAAHWVRLWILRIRSGLSAPRLLLFFHLFPHQARSPQRHQLNQLNGHVVQPQFWFSVSPAELYRSALVTSLLTLSFLLMWTQEGWLHRGFGAYPGSGEVPLNTCSERYALGQSWRVMVTSFGLFTSFLSIVFPLWMLTSLSDSLLLINSSITWVDTTPVPFYNAVYF